MNTLGLAALIASGLAIGLWIGMAARPIIDREGAKKIKITLNGVNVSRKYEDREE